jgi:hypothetical protein
MHFTLCPQNEEILFWPHSKQTKDKRDFLINFFKCPMKPKNGEEFEFYGHLKIWMMKSLYVVGIPTLFYRCG